MSLVVDVIFGRGDLVGGDVVDGAAFDDDALACANLALGNAWDDRALEVTVGPLTLRAVDDVHVAVKGSRANDGVVVLRAGEVLRLWPAALRFVVAVPGGLPPHHHNRFDIVSRGSVLHPGAGTPLGSGAALINVDRQINVDPQGLEGHPPSSCGTVRVVRGPDVAAANSEELERAWEQFLDVDWRVSPTSSRLGVRLDGPALPVPPQGSDVITRGTWTGAIQLTSSGQPIVLGPDQRRTGGYAELGRVIAVDRWQLAQKRPGDTIRFVAIDVDAARALLKERHEAQRRRR